MAMSKPLFDCSDEGEADFELTTNKEYAKSYNNFRKKELVKKFKDRGYDVSESDSDNSSSSSDEEELDPTFDNEFYKTLAFLKSKDPKIYDKNTKFFTSVDQKDSKNKSDENSSKPNKKSKPVTLKDYDRKVLLEHGGKFEDESENESVEENNQRSFSPTIVEEEKQLKAEFKQVLEDINSDDEGFGGIFQKRQKTKEEEAKEEESFTKWLAGKDELIESDVKQKLVSLKNYWDSEKLPQSERFLRDYILNRGYVNANSNDIPTYDEIVGDKVKLSDDEEELQKQAEFEQKFNFRFEEPDTEFIKRYPRTVEASVRRTDDKRKQKRKEIKERKEQEKQQKMKELEILKEIKRREIQEKIEKLKKVSGNDELGFNNDELDEDFDPEKHDKRMQELFNDDYYQVDEGEEKPDYPSDIEELRTEDWDNYDPSNFKDDENDDYYEPHCEDDDFNMDCDYDPAKAKEELQKELIENTKSRKSRKRHKNRFKEIIQAEKPKFDPEDEKTYEEYIDEYYKIDCEDIIGDVPCRFKYVETVPNDFGLTIEEILLAKNKELNQWASLKKAVQIRPEHVEKKDQRLYKMKAKNEALKRKIFRSLYGDGSDSEEGDNDDAPTEKTEDSQVPISANETSSTITKKKKKRRRGKSKADGQKTNVTEEKLNEPKKENETNVEKNPADTQVVDTNGVSKEPRKRKLQPENGEKVIDASGPSSAKTQKLSVSASNNSPAQQNKSVNTNGKTPESLKKPVNTNNPFNKKKSSGNIMESTVSRNKKNKNKFNKQSKLKELNNGLSNERFRAYNINPKKFMKGKMYGKQSK